MKLLEIKNNLVKLSYEEGDIAVLGGFIVLGTAQKSYVAQFVNLKSDHVQNYAIAKLLFTFTSDGVVDDYDGSIPAMDSELSMLEASELLEILPVESALKIGNLAQQEEILQVDMSIFENNLAVYVERNSDKACFISNCVRQLFQAKEKSVIIDYENLFEGYPKIEFSKDFKLPLNSETIDFLFDFELADIDVKTKAVIQDIFYSVQQYIDTLEYRFLPIDSFVDVVSAQYKENQMPELALLKNKLLKYRDENIFANTKEEFLNFSKLIEEKNCSIVDIHNVGDELQNVVAKFILGELDKFDKYIYLFLPLNDYNSDKKLLKSYINNNHVFTTTLVSSSYKYAQELKQHAQNIILFAPKNLDNEFSPYMSFINKLNTGECIVYGNLTHDIPFIVNIYDLELALTKDDVFGEHFKFVPVTEELLLVNNEGIPVNEKTIFSNGQDYEEESIFENVEDNINQNSEVLGSTNDEYISLQEEEQQIEEAVGDDLSIEESAQDVDFEENISEDITPEEIVDADEFDDDNNEKDSDLNDLELTEDDLDYFDESAGSNEQVSLSEEENPVVVPVYPAESETVEEDVIYNFSQGDTVSHPKYGRGVVEKIIKYGNKTLCSISFDNVGRRLLDPSISEFEKV